KELKAVSGLLVEPRRPCVYVLGGAKVEDKIPVIEHILTRDKADKILLGGVPAKVFLKAMDKKISADDEKDMAGLQTHIKNARSLSMKYKDRLEVLEAMAKSNGYTVIGGGHLVGLASILGIDERFKHVSTAGGAMLSLLSGQNLPGVDALVRAAERMRNQKPN